MARTSRRRRGEFLSSYRLDDAYLLKPDRRHGVPGILAGTDGDGNSCPPENPLFSATADHDFQPNWMLRCGNSPRFGILTRPGPQDFRPPDRISRLSQLCAHREPFPLQAGHE